MIALVTGASSGIGEATAKRIAREPGAKLILVARRQDRMDAIAAEIGGATVIAIDLTDDDAPAKVAEQVEAEHGRLDLLVNNAGAAWRGTFGDTGWENLERHMKLNFESVARLTESLLPILRRSAPSSIVNVASTAGRVSRANSGAYSASKFALAGWTDALHLEEREHGVHVGMVLPGFVETEGFPQKELVDKPHTRWIVSTAGQGRRGDHGRGPRWQGRALRAARLRAGGSVARCHAVGGPACALGRRQGVHALDGRRPRLTQSAGDVEPSPVHAERVSACRASRREPPHPCGCPLRRPS